MILEANNGFVVATVVLIATLSSVLGALAGYGIGMYGGGWFLEKFVSESTIARLNVLVERYGSAGIFIAVSLAYSLQGSSLDCRSWSNGYAYLWQPELLAEGLDLEFQAHYWGIYGESMKSSMTGVEGAITFSIVSILGLIIVIPASRWWKGLLVEEE